MRTTQRCLMCGSQIAFLKKIASGSFCSDEHRDKYHAQLDFIIFDRLKSEKRRLVRNASIAPAPLAQLLRRGANSLPPLGTGATLRVEPLPASLLCVPQHKVTLTEIVRESPYLHGVSAKWNPGMRRTEPEPRGMRRLWPKSPAMPRDIAGISRLCRPQTTAIHASGPAKARFNIAASGFNRGFALRW